MLGDAASSISHIADSLFEVGYRTHSKRLGVEERCRGWFNGERAGLRRRETMLVIFSVSLVVRVEEEKSRKSVEVVVLMLHS